MVQQGRSVVRDSFCSGSTLEWSSDLYQVVVFEEREVARWRIA